MEWIVGVVLGIGALEDMKQKTVCVWVPVIGCVLAVAGHMIRRTASLPEVLLGALIGLVSLALAKISGGQIGAGDGWMMLACGICLGWKRQMAVLLLAMILFLLVGAVGIGLRLWSGKKPLAFVPYLGVSFIVQLFLGRVVCIP